MSQARQSLQRQYEDDGAVLLNAALDAPSLAAAEAAYDWSLAHPGPGATRFVQATDAVFLNDLYTPQCLTGYRAMLEASPLPALIANIWDAPDVWFFYEQVFLKAGGETRRTPWHQDSSYLAIAGRHLAVAWISFDPVPRADALEFVRASHKGRLYNGSRFELGDDTAPTNPHSSLPRLPDIQAGRADWDIVGFATKPGDVVLFHPAMLHGGAPTHPGGRRRTLTLRFFGQDAVYDAREGHAGPRISGFHQRMRTGDPFRDPSFLKLR
jgi:ectoine hydroxylase-related dioxygenase (phytanoyl-CoA dioxygenase family)